MIKQEVTNKLISINDYNLLLDISYMAFFKNDKQTRVHVTKRFNIADITIKTILRRLLDQGYLNKVKRGVYKINPDILC